MPTLDQLVARLQAIKASRITVTAYRSTTPEYAKEADLNTGEGSKLHGSRWNPPGIAAVYASFTPETAMEESLAHFRNYGFPFMRRCHEAQTGKRKAQTGTFYLFCVS
jgi:RES domain-containing protein